MPVYEEQTWVDGTDGGTPLSAARLNHMEEGISNAGGVPTAGADGQVLTKASATNFDTEWVDPSGGFDQTDYLGALGTIPGWGDMPGFVDPTATDGSKGYLLVNYDSGAFGNLAVGYGAAGNQFVAVSADAASANIYIESPTAGSFLSLKAGDDATFLQVHAEPSQTAALLELIDESSVTKFSVGPDGALSHLLPLGKVTAAGQGGKPALFDPDSTVWSDGANVSFGWNPASNGFSLGIFADDSTAGDAFIYQQAYAQAGPSSPRHAAHSIGVDSDDWAEAVYIDQSATLNRDGTGRVGSLRVYGIGDWYAEMAVDADSVHLGAQAVPGQTAPLLELKDEDGVSRWQMNQDSTGLLGNLGKTGTLAGVGGWGSSYIGIFDPDNAQASEGWWGMLAQRYPGAGDGTYWGFGWGGGTNATDDLPGGQVYGWADASSATIELDGPGAPDAGYASIDVGTTSTVLRMKAALDQAAPFIVLSDNSNAEVLTIGPVLATSDPHIVGRVWNSSGTLKVSAG